LNSDTDDENLNSNVIVLKPFQLQEKSKNNGGDAAAEVDTSNSVKSLIYVPKLIIVYFHCSVYLR